MKIRYLAILTMLVMIAGLSACVVAGATPAETVQEAAPTGFANPDVLVDTAWVNEHLEDEGVHLIDVSDNQESFAEGHLPGARYVNWQADLTNPDDPVRGQILTGDDLSALLSRLGVEKDDTIILYDNTNNLFAARAYWVLKYYRHDDVRIYNGGVKKWTAEGETLSTDEAPAATASQYTAGEPDPAIRTSWEYVVEHTDDPETLFCDTRGPKEYAGTDARSAQGGHVPGAINVNWTQAVNDADGTFREAAALADLYQKAGFSPDKEIITYCQTGVRGAHTWFVLKELLGYPNVRNYDGSWEEYGNNPESPIES